MYRDFEDLRDNCPVSLRADIAIDLIHDNPHRLAEAWPATADGGFRLALTDAVTRFWEGTRCASGRAASCPTTPWPSRSWSIRTLTRTWARRCTWNCMPTAAPRAWATSAGGCSTTTSERRFGAEMGTRVVELLEAVSPGHGLRCIVEVNEVEED